MQCELQIVTEYINVAKCFHSACNRTESLPISEVSCVPVSVQGSSWTLHYRKFLHEEYSTVKLYTLITEKRESMQFYLIFFLKTFSLNFQYIKTTHSNNRL